MSIFCSRATWISPATPVARIPPQGKGVAALVGDVTKNGVHRLQPGQFLEKDPAVAHGQILPLDQRVAQVAGKQGLFKVDRAVRAGREQDDVGIFMAPGGALHQAVVESLKERGQPPDLGAGGTTRETCGK